MLFSKNIPKSQCVGHNFRFASVNQQYSTCYAQNWILIYRYVCGKIELLSKDVGFVRFFSIFRYNVFYFCRKQSGVVYNSTVGLLAADASTKGVLFDV